jgi:phosphohistidine swiveling domain-containing protein
MNQLHNSNLYSGGLAEIVSQPTPLTYSFFAHWFSGDVSLGRGMGLLQLPYSPQTISVLTLSEQDMYVDLRAEEAILYNKTLLHYKQQISPHETPKLSVNFQKVLSPIRIFHTLSLIKTQSQWIAQPKKITEQLARLLKSIPQVHEEMNTATLDETLGKHVWPVVIAIGAVAEYFMQLLENESSGEFQHLQMYISTKLRNRDWFFRSFSDQQKIMSGEMSFKTYLNHYGIRADKDYELSCPRWKEIPNLIQKRIREMKQTEQHNTETCPRKYTTRVDTVIETQVLRAEAKRKALQYIALLRTALLNQYKHDDLPLLTREQILGLPVKTRIQQTQYTTIHHSQKHATSGKGRPVSSGEVTGIAYHFSHPGESVPDGTIGIFPNASPEFAMQYPKCRGMIFLKGGQTSHGAIVAREYHIPALIDHAATMIPPQAEVSLNGASGSWHVLTHK